MRKFFPQISKTTFLIALILIMGGFLMPEAAHAQAGAIAAKAAGYIGDAFADVLGWVAINVVLRLTALLTTLSGAILNFVVGFTVVDMADNLDKADAVNRAWSTIRDVANMGFIFILLYAAIQLILGIGQNVQRLIVNIVIVAILINFSLFFTRVVIDASNILAVTFYGAMAPNALDSNLNGGIANSLMEPMKLSSIMSINSESTDGGGAKLGGSTLIIIGIMGSVVALIASFVFFAVAIMFIIRFVVLIFVMILSPLAFVAFILPALNKYKDQWWNALSGQAFFAPIYFMLTWIVIVLAQGLFKGTEEGTLSAAFTGITRQNADGTTSIVASEAGILVLMNFVIIIALIIASLMVAKEWANKAGPAVSGMTKWAMGAAGGATLGLVGGVGRRTLGAYGASVANNEKLKEDAKKGGFTGMRARLNLAAGRKIGGASFDLRGAPGGEGLGAGRAGGKGGFIDYKKKKAEEAAKRAAALAPSEEVMDQAEQEVNKHKEGTPERSAAQARLDNLKGVSSKEAKEREDEQKAKVDTEKKKALEENPDINHEKEVEAKIEEVEKKREQAEKFGATAEIAVLNEELARLEEEKKLATEAANVARKEIEDKYEARKNAIKVDTVEGAAARRKTGYAQVMEKSIWATIMGYNKAAAAKIRKGKSNKDKLAEAAAAFVKDQEEKPEEKSEEKTPKPPAPPAGGGPASGTPPTS